MSVSAIIVRGYGSWSSVSYVPTLGYRTSSWTDPTNCSITTGVTMPANSISTAVTMPANTISADVTMPVNAVTGDVGIGCGYQN